MCGICVLFLCIRLLTSSSRMLLKVDMEFFLRKIHLKIKFSDEFATFAISKFSQLTLINTRQEV